MEDCLEVLGEVHGVILLLVTFAFSPHSFIGVPLIGDGFSGVFFRDAVFDGLRR